MLDGDLKIWGYLELTKHNFVYITFMWEKFVSNLIQIFYFISETNANFHWKYVQGQGSL